MKLGVSNLSSSVRLALSLGAVVAIGASSTAFAQDTSGQQGSQSSDQKAKTLQTVVVTGSHIRRVDLETASPVVTIDAQAIKASGKLTLGDLVQDLPAVTGGNTNPQVNNSGGAGSSSIGLRGLGPNRTLILVNGQRVVNTDANSIPSNMIERIDVLTTGASSVYGSDAVGGVVNFILKKNYQGAQFSAKYGESDHNDGASSGYSFTFGTSSDKGSIMGGVDYSKIDSIIASQRKFSSQSLTAFSDGNGGVKGVPGGSTSSPYGYIQLPNSLSGTMCTSGANAGFVARNPGAAGSAVGDYHCYQQSDKYNYAAVNLIETPQERTNVFLMGNYSLSDHVTAFMNAYYNKTSSLSQLAPATLTTDGGATLSAQSYFNPFGVDYGAGQYTFKDRLSVLGPRVFSNGVTTAQINTGFKGDIQLGNQDWNWDAGLDYGHISQVQILRGLPNGTSLNQGAGPSYLDPTSGQVMCGTPGNPIANCLPFNPLNLNSSYSEAALAAAAAPAINNFVTQEKIWYADANGGLFDLPAGTVQLAAGLAYRQEYAHNTVDPLLQVNSSGICTLGSSCSGALQGGYNVKEAYAEAFIPLLSGLPGVQSLNVTLGDRYSKFSNFGSTNNAKVALEWKPINDLLLRGTVAQVFRAPNIGEIYGAPSIDYEYVGNDPCNGYTGSPVNPACVNVKTDGSYQSQPQASNNQTPVLAAGANYAHYPLKPEVGKTFDLGAVYSPSWAPGLSSTVDVWHLYLNNTITSVLLQSVLNLCSAGNTAFCPAIQRYASGPNQGQIMPSTIEPTANLGNTQVGGIDFSLNYKLPQFDQIGQFTVGVNGTYLKYYNVNTAPGTPQNTTYYDAGHFQPYGSSQAAACPGASGNCLFPRWRAQGYVNWNMGDWNASWRMRYIGRFQNGSLNEVQATGPVVGAPATTVLKYGATVYNDVSLGYNIEPLHTRVDFGINNLFNKLPPMLYANNTLNSNTDPSDFDLIGRYFWGRVTVSF